MDWAAYTRVVYEPGVPEVSGGTPLHGLLMPTAGNSDLADEDFDAFDELHASPAPRSAA